MLALTTLLLHKFAWGSAWDVKLVQKILISYMYNPLLKTQLAYNSVEFSSGFPNVKSVGSGWHEAWKKLAASEKTRLRCWENLN